MNTATIQFENGEKAVLASTGNKKIDGSAVIVTGIAVDHFPVQVIYIVEKEDGSLWHNGYMSIAISSNCLKKAL